VSDQHLTRKEQAELILMENNMWVNKEKKRMVVKYPIIKDPSVLTDNYGQAVKMTTSLEKRLVRDGMLDKYNTCMEEFLTRPCMREIPKGELKAWKSQINYISHHPVLKPSSTSTPVRIVSNSSINNNGSGHSYNSILAKGPNYIQPLFKILIKFRSYERVCVWDIHKAYSLIRTGEDELHMRRLLWRWGKGEDDWTVYGFTHVPFGDIPTAPFLELMKKAANKLGRHFCPKTAEQMDEGYVDDGFGGGKDKFIDTVIE
jgi:hypothetical protein